MTEPPPVLRKQSRGNAVMVPEWPAVGGGVPVPVRGLGHRHRRALCRLVNIVGAFPVFREAFPPSCRAGAVPVPAVCACRSERQPALYIVQSN